MDASGKTSFINDIGANMLGYTPNEMIGQPGTAYIFVEDQAHAQAQLKRRQQGINERKEQRFRHKDGYEVWIRSSISSQFNENEQYEGTLMMFNDITTKKNAEAALRETNERFRFVLNATQITMFYMDADLRYTWVHSASAEYQEADLLGKRDEEITSTENAAILTPLKQSVLDSGNKLRKEIRLLEKKGWRQYDLILEPLKNNQNETIGLAGTAVDVTDVRRIEEESLKNSSRVEVQQRLIQQREQERLQIARDLHDTVLQELIAIHFNFSEALSIPDKDMRLQKMEVLQHEIRTQIHELRDFCNDLRPPSLMSFGLERAIRSHMSAFRERYPGYRCSLNLFQDRQIIPEDARMALYRIYQEALSNIIKHAEASRVWVRLSMHKNLVEMEIRDDGKGFHLPERWPELLTHTGHFGLLGMQERVEAVGGTLKILSKVGKGTKVISVIPVKHLSSEEL